MPTPEQIADIVLDRRPVYGLDTDSRIRETANRLTARAFYELLERLDVQSPEFPTHLSDLLRAFPNQSPAHLIGFDTGSVPSTEEHSETSEEPDSPEPPAEPSEHYLRLVFRDEQAAYYQFYLFPDLDADIICGVARKRAGAVQHLRIELTHPEALEDFIESCHSNPHLLRVEQSTADEFHRAPSHAI